MTGFHREKEFQQFHTSKWDFSTIPEGKTKHLAAYAFKAKSSLIQRMSIQKKLALLVAFGCRIEVETVFSRG